MNYLGIPAIAIVALAIACGDGSATVTPTEYATFMCDNSDLDNLPPDATNGDALARLRAAGEGIPQPPAVYADYHALFMRIFNSWEEALDKLDENAPFSLYSLLTTEAIATGALMAVVAEDMPADARATLESAGCDLDIG